MSFINSQTSARVAAPGWFLVHPEDCNRETRQMVASAATTDYNGGKYIPMGTAYPSNDASAIGIVYEDVDVSSGDMPGSVVTRGTVYQDRLPSTFASAAVSALSALGFKFVATSPSVTRPSEFNIPG